MISRQNSARLLESHMCVGCGNFVYIFPLAFRFGFKCRIGTETENNLKIGKNLSGGKLLSSRRANFTIRTFPARSLTIPGAWSRARAAASRCCAASAGRCASLRAVCVAIPYLSLHLCNPRFIADDYARMEVRAAGGWGGGGDGALAHGYRTAAIDWRDRDVVLDVSLLSIPNTVLYLLVEERISLHRSPFLRPLIDLPFSLSLDRLGDRELSGSNGEGRIKYIRAF